MSSNGDEMFKALGYNKKQITDEFIVYSKKELRHKREWEICIDFNCYDKYLITKNKSYFCLEELQAINKKCQELRWLMNSIDILEDLLSTQKQYIEDKDYQKEHNIKEQAIDYAKMWTKATETLIAENKELKEEKEELKRENLEIRDWKYVIDSPIDLDKLKELDLIKIKGKEYISKSIYNELEKDKKALVNNYSNVLGHFISVDKIKAKIEDILNSENGEAIEKLIEWRTLLEKE